MNNFEDKIKHDANSAQDSRHFHQDPIIQARDDSGISHNSMPLAEIVHSVKEPVLATNTRSFPNQFMGNKGPTPPNILDSIKSILRFKWTILTVFILVAAPSITAIWTLVVPKYRARAELRIQPIIPYLVFRTEDNGRIPLYDSFVNTQVSIMRSPTVLQRVLDQKEVQQTQWYKTAERSLKQQLLGNPVPPNMERLKTCLSASPRRGTEIMDISFVDKNPEDARIIVGAVLVEYIKYIREMTNQEKDIIQQKLVEEHTKLGNEIKGREEIIARLRHSLGTVSPEKLISDMRIRLEDTRTRLDELQKNIKVLEWESTQTDKDSDNVPDASIVAMEKQKKYYEDREWRGLDRNVRNIQHQMATSLFTRKHPDWAKAEKDLKFAQELLRLREAQLDEQRQEQQTNNTSEQSKNTPVVPIIITTNGLGLGYEEGTMSLEHQLKRAKEEEKVLNDQLKKQEEVFQTLFTEAQTLENEVNELQHKRDLFKAVQQRIDAKVMESNVEGTIKVLTEAFVPSMPSNDRRIVFTAMALFMSLGTAGGIAFLRAIRSQTIYSHKDMPYPMQVPFLGYIPACRTRRSPDKEFNPALIESIRVIRTALLTRLNGQDNSTVLITSADASTGKSTFTLMLGKSLAQAGKKVLVIDSDFRKITLTKRFNLPDKSGFLESLSSRSIDKRHIFPTETSGLSIMPAGKRTNNCAIFEETANGAFRSCINQLRKQYDIILLDSSPILPVADATILSSQVDGTIMVEREFVSRRANVINALSRLDSAGGRLLGTVFVGTSDIDGYGYDYKYSRTIESQYSKSKKSI